MYGWDYVYGKATQNNEPKLWQDYRKQRHEVTSAINKQNIFILITFIPFAEMILRKCGPK